ncbi:MAG: adenylate/guanylate cyclase domain-containing protein [Anaerolineales bacterium]
MWLLTIRVPGKEPQKYTLKPGGNTIGRHPNNDIVIAEPSASRQHARIDYNRSTDTALLQDLSSTNGTYINRRRLSYTYRLQHLDMIRIGSSTINVVIRGTDEPLDTVKGPQKFTRERLLEALDHHTVLMYQISERLNTVLNLAECLEEIGHLMKQAMGADKCKVILKEQFDRMEEFGFPSTLANSAIKEKSAVVIPDMAQSDAQTDSDSATLLKIRSALCVPIMAENQVIGLIYMYKSRPDARPFTNTDLQVAIAISHQAALTIQRVNLLNKVQQEQSLRQMFQRFVSPQEVDYVLRDYDLHGTLPGLKERKISVLFADIADSTGLAEAMGAQEFGKLLNKYYLEITNIIFEFNGVVRYLGDGVLSVFGMSDDGGDYKQKAVESSITILKRMRDLSSEFDQPLKLRLSIKAGRAVVGYVGTQERVEFTVLGDLVNVAKGMNPFASPNKIVVGEETYQAVSDEYKMTKLDSIIVKGRKGSVKIYEVDIEDL